MAARISSRLPTMRPQQTNQLPYRSQGIRLRDHRRQANLFAGDDAPAWTVTFIHQSNTANGFELFRVAVAARIVAQLRACRTVQAKIGSGSV